MHSTKLDAERREVLKAMLGAAVGLGMTACSSSGSAPAPASEATAPVVQAGHGTEAALASSVPAVGDIENIAQMHEVAKLRWKARPAGAVDLASFVDLGADDGKTRVRNSTAFEDWQLVARRLVDVHQVNTSVSVFGKRYDLPLFLCPVALLDALHEDGVVGVAHEAAKRNMLQMVSMWNRPPIEKTFAAGNEPWVQMFPLLDKRARAAYLERAEAGGAKVLVLTVDTPVLGNREGTADFLNAKGSARGQLRVLTEGYGLGSFADRGFDSKVIGNDPSTAWTDIAALRKSTKMKLVLKGIVTAEDARLCLEHGVDGVVVSNHGGRQEESLRGTVESLPAVASVLKGKLPILLDGGVRRGSDVVKALALGADMVGVGRPCAWGLGAYGAPGAGRVMDIFRAEITRTMQLLGATSIEALGDKTVISHRAT